MLQKKKFKKKAKLKLKINLVYSRELLLIMTY